jgi:hypothetical protein
MERPILLNKLESCNVIIEEFSLFICDLEVMLVKSMLLVKKHHPVNLIVK